MNHATEANVEDAALESTGPRHTARTFRFCILLWLVFFLICFGLGYPTLNRYQPSRIEGLSDSAIYYQMVIGASSNRPRAQIFEGRILVPYVAKPFYRIAKLRLPTWDPVYFALLVANSLFCATASLLLVGAGLIVTNNAGTALLGATLYLLNFSVPNLQLAGLVDSGEACFMMLLAWALLTRRWWLLPLVGIGGALAKETFVPFASVFATVWWWRSRPAANFLSRNFFYVLALILLSELTTVIIHLMSEGRFVAPWNVVAVMNSHSNYLQSFFRCISNQGFWYVFLWLLPLGVWGGRQLPREWISASLLAGLTALVFGVYNDMAGTVARPIFNVVGPMLTLSVAILLTKQLALLHIGSRPPSSEHR